MNKTLTIAALAALCASSYAQLIVTTDDLSATTPNAWFVDINTGAATVLWNSPDAGWGAAADNSAGVIYTSGGSDLFAWNFGDVGTSPTLIDNFQDASGTSLVIEGLAWANGSLYGSRVANSAANPEGIYSIDVTTGVATLEQALTSADFMLSGFDYSPTTGLFYGTNDDSTPARGLYSFDVFGTGTISLVTAYPAGETDIDGLAIGGDRAYLIEDDASSGIHVYNLVTNSYEASLPNPVTTSEIFSGGAWAPNALVPEPASFAVLGLGALALLRRRKK